MADAPITLHKLDLTNGAAAELAALATVRGLLTKPSLIRRVSKFVKEHLRDLPPDCKDPGEMAAWAEASFISPEITERTRDALKALLKAAAEKGALSGTVGTGHLLEVLAVGDEEA
jgi:hypothetical protein